MRAIGTRRPSSSTAWTSSLNSGRSPTTPTIEWKWLSRSAGRSGKAGARSDRSPRTGIGADHVVVIDDLDGGRACVAPDHPALDVHREEVALVAGAGQLDEPAAQVLLGFLGLDQLEDLPGRHQALFPAGLSSPIS